MKSEKFLFKNKFSAALKITAKRNAGAAITAAAFSLLSSVIIFAVLEVDFFKNKKIYIDVDITGKMRAAAFAVAIICVVYNLLSAMQIFNNIYKESV